MFEFEVIQSAYTGTMTVDLHGLHAKMSSGT